MCYPACPERLAASRLRNRFERIPGLRLGAHRFRRPRPPVHDPSLHRQRRTRFLSLPQPTSRRLRGTRPCRPAILTLDRRQQPTKILLGMPIRIWVNKQRLDTSDHLRKFGRPFLQVRSRNRITVNHRVIPNTCRHPPSIPDHVAKLTTTRQTLAL